MSEFENGYYWVSYEGMNPIIMEKDKFGWNAFGIETEVDINNYKVLGKVSEWCNNEEKEALPLHVVSNNEVEVCDYKGTGFCSYRCLSRNTCTIIRQE